MMVDCSPAELGGAFAQLELSKRQIEEANEQLARAAAELRNAAREYLMSAEGEEQIRRASQLYWNVPEVPVSVISLVLLGLPNASGKLVALIGPGKATIPCASCGAEMPATSRTAIADSKRGGRFIHKRCRACENAGQASIAANWAAEERVRIERIAALRTMPYRDYLLTEEWLETRNRKLRQARYRCQLCNTNGLLNVHHRTYERRGCEDMADLTVLCRPCHAKHHDKPL
jgi:hypothetical protein